MSWAWPPDSSVREKPARDEQGQQQVRPVQPRVRLFRRQQFDADTVDAIDVLNELLSVLPAVLVDDAGGGLEEGMPAEGPVHQGEGDDGQEQAEGQVAFILEVQSDLVEGDE